MPKDNQKGIAHILLILLLVAGLAVGVYLVQQKTNFLPKATFPGPPETPPHAALILEALPLRKVVSEEGISYFPKEEFMVKLLASSDIEESNLFLAKISFPQELLEVVRIDYDFKGQSFIKNWVEQYYDNQSGVISLSGGVPAPGYKTTPGQPGLMAVIVFKAKTKGTATVSFADQSAIYRNSDNQNVLTSTTKTVVLIKEPEVCVQVVTPAKDPKTGECKEFPTPCDVPAGWEKVDNCPGITCNTDVSLRAILSGNQVNFKINGDASTYLQDDYGGGVKPETCFGEWNNKTCQVVAPGKYTWTHSWRHCVNSVTNCSPASPACTISASYTTSKGDGNKDGKINLVDMSVLLSWFNKSGQLPSIDTIDMNDDKVINSFDFALMRKLLIELGAIKGS